MKRIDFEGLPLWQFDNLASETAIRHFVSGRQSSDAESEFTLSFSSHPDKDFIRRNRLVLAKAMRIDGDRLVFPSQVHKTRIVKITPSTEKAELQETDALITNEKGICIAVMSADCVPIILFDKKNKAIAAVHSGWRGTVARILEKTLKAMKDEFGTQGKDIVAGIGPSASQENYEVGEEVIAEVNRAFDNSREMLIAVPGKKDKAKLDLWHANKFQLMEFGVPESNIEVSNLCTIKNNEYFFSARKGDSGRFAAGILLQ